MHLFFARCLRSACLPLGGDGYEDDHDRQSLKHLPMSHSKRNTTAVPFPWRIIIVLPGTLVLRQDPGKEDMMKLA